MWEVPTLPTVPDPEPASIVEAARSLCGLATPRAVELLRRALEAIEAERVNARHMIDLPRRPDWHQHAACRGMTELMYPSQGDDVRPAIAICNRCPVIEPCLEYALDNVERFGIWAGLSEKPRRRLRSQRRQAATTEERSA